MRERIDCTYSDIGIASVYEPMREPDRSGLQGRNRLASRAPLAGIDLLVKRWGSTETSTRRALSMACLNAAPPPPHHYSWRVDEQVLTALRLRGFTPGDVLGAGMEGTVVDLSGDHVAKVWHGRSRDDLRALLEFGLALDAAPIPFATAGAVELLDQDGLLVTIERKVRGDQLASASRQDPPTVSEHEAQIIGDALAGLSRASDPRLALLPVLPGESPVDPAREFGQSLADLVLHRFTATGGSLRTYVPDIDSIAMSLLRQLRALPPLPRKSLIHGDLIPANILVSDGKVSGVLDFGFLTTIGDPRFDAAIAASIFDMYGDNARSSEEILSARFIDRFGHDDRVYALYRGAYAVITHAVFGADDSDGHFSWCVEMLRRADIRAAIFA